MPARLLAKPTPTEVAALSAPEAMTLPVSPRSPTRPLGTGLKLHLGCGSRHIKGYFHVDALPLPNVDHVGPVERLDFIESECVNLIYACHVLEHFGRNQVFDVLCEWYRVLRPGGILRLSVPDFRAIAAFYLRNGDLRQIYGAVLGGQVTPYDQHKALFDEISLGELLLDVGFRDVWHYDWRQTEHAAIDDFSQAYLPHLDKENGTPISLNVEAVK